MKVRFFNPHDVADLEARWRRLAGRAGAPFFLQWDWAATALATAPGDVVLIEIMDGDRDVALALAGRAVEARNGFVRSRQLRLNEIGPAGDTVPIEYNTLLAAPDEEAAAWDALLGALMTDGAPDWDEIVVTNADAALQTRLLGKGLMAHRRAFAGSGKVDLGKLRAAGVNDVDGYVASLGRSTRSQIRRSIKIFEERGPLAAERAGSVAEALDWFETIAELHEAKWRARGGKGLKSAPTMMRFHRDLIRRALPGGGVELVRVRAGDTPFAWLYNFLDDRSALFNIGGFAGEDDNRVKPGLVAHALAIEAHLNSGRATYDFLAGDDRYKLNLGEKGVDFAAFAIQRPTAALKLEQALRRIKNRLEDMRGRNRRDAA